MKTTYRLLIIFLAFIFIQACKTTIPVIQADEFVTLDTVQVNSNSEREIYRASETRVNDLLHTKLEVTFGWDSAFLYGKAHLQFVPYFYATDSLTLDAKGFQIHKVALVDKIGKRTPLTYSYDQSFLKIDLGKTYTRKDTYNIFVDYTAMPNKLKAGGSLAITQAKGLYFINPDGSDPDKPKQIWTQGETEASSCWFPTIDAPNEKTTQEIYITVDSQYVTLSNGELMFQSENPDGTRTDYWMQSLPHAPYLFMMAVGEFAVAKDEWRGKPVHYYVEPKYADVARDIYPNTVEMLEFFSTKLGYEYPWDKYHQIVVRDYVSGAMENTGAVIFGDFVQGNERFLIDNAAEDIVAHELFHHWFGDLVTCESWSNLPLNESFATYGEYLWNEHKYGKDQADLHGRGNLRTYLGQSRINKKKLIRFNYGDEMEMFDSHSYQKGGRVLHLLRNHVGDDAFFALLKLYLESNEFQSVEIHQLRLAFEKVTGEDLNWFFNQWFFGAGHPILEIEKSFTNDTLSITVKQTQDGAGVAKIFLLPTTIGIVQANGLLLEKKVTISERTQTIKIKQNSAPLLVNFDIEKVLIGVINQAIERNEAITLYNNSYTYLDKYDAIKMLKNKKDSSSLDIISGAMNDDFWYIRKTAIDNTKKLAKIRPESTLAKLKLLAEKDPKSSVRAAAINAISKNFEETIDLAFLDRGIEDLSFKVVSASLDAIYKKNKEAGVIKAHQLENEENASILLTIASIYAIDGKPEQKAFFNNTLKKTSGFNKYPLLISYGEFLEKQDNPTIESAIPSLAENAKGDGTWFIRMAAVNSLIKLKQNKEEEQSSIATEIEKEEDIAEKAKLTTQKTSVEQLTQKLIASLKEIREEETNSRLKNLIEGELE
ncbi:MAG: M1 family metallopeptidase [Flavobacteriales bacterium]|nr:M1 family metallopeptidase [Flavobacteriales bacterium]